MFLKVKWILRNRFFLYRFLVFLCSRTNVSKLMSFSGNFKSPGAKISVTTHVISKFLDVSKSKMNFPEPFFLYRDPICGSPSNRDAHLSIFRFVQIIWVDFARDSVSAKVKHQSDHFRPKYIDPSIKKYRDNAQFHRIEQSGEIPMSKIRWSPLREFPWNHVN